MKLLHSWTPRPLIDLKNLVVRAFADTASVKSNLSLIGVDQKYHSAPPSLVSFPSRFNPKAHDLWSKVIQEHDVSPFTIAKQWESIIELFMDACEENGISAFKDTPDVSDNRRVIEVLTNARKKLISFFDTSRIFDIVTVSYKGTSFITDASTLKVTSYAEITGYGSIHNLVNYLKTLGFKDKPQGMRLALSPVCTVCVEKITDNSALVSYEIIVSTPVYHPAMRVSIVPEAELQTWIDKNIWKPIVRSHRFKTAKSTLFLEADMTGIMQLQTELKEEATIINLDPNVHSDQLIKQYTNRIDYLVSIIRGLTERSDDDIKDAVSFEISKINPLSFDDAVTHVRETYNQSFFRLEHDVDYKISLCRAVLMHMRMMNSGYENPLLDSIATKNANVADLITPIWKRESA